MNKFKQAFISFMSQKGIKYDEVNETTIKVSYNAENMNSISVFVAFDDEEAATVHFMAWGIGKFHGDKLANGLVVCNMLNQKYRWVRFYLDNDQDVCVDMDAYLELSTAGDECMKSVIKVVNIADEAYPEIMKALYA